LSLLPKGVRSNVWIINTGLSFINPSLHRWRLRSRLQTLQFSTVPRPCRSGNYCYINVLLACRGLAQRMKYLHVGSGRNITKICQLDSMNEEKNRLLFYRSSLLRKALNHYVFEYLSKKSEAFGKANEAYKRQKPNHRPESKRNGGLQARANRKSEKKE